MNAHVSVLADEVRISTEFPAFDRATMSRLAVRAASEVARQNPTRDNYEEHRKKKSLWPRIPPPLRHPSPMPMPVWTLAAPIAPNSGSSISRTRLLLAEC